MNRFNIGARLTAAFASIVILLLIVAGIGWKSLSSNAERMDDIVNDNNVKIAVSNRLLLDLNLLARSARNYIIYSDKETQTRMRGRIEGATKTFTEGMDKLGSMVTSADAKALYGEIKTQAPETLRLLNQVMTIVDTGSTGEASKFLMSAVQAQQDGTFAKLNAMVDYQEKQNHLSVEAMNHGNDVAVRVLVGSALFACVAALVLGWSITRSITRPLNRAVEAAQTVAGGDLTHEIQVDGKDEVSRLLSALKAMTASLASIVGEVRAGTETISTASREIASGNMDLSSRTEEQASSLEETASSMEELTSTVKQNADRKSVV